MIPLKEEVTQAYRTLLGREPENEEIIRRMQALHGSVLELVLSIQGSQEYRNRTMAAQPAQPMYPDSAILERFRTPVKAKRGFVTDWLGVRTNRSFSPALAGLAPVLDPASLNPRDTAICGAILAAVEAATERFAVADIGAGWGRWAVLGAVTAGKRGIPTPTVLAAEAQPDRCAYLRQHLDSNGIPSAQAILFQGVIAPEGPTALFPVVDAHLAEDTGAVFPDHEPKPDVVYAKLPALSLDDLLGRHNGQIDVCCVDVPGASDIVLASLAAVARQIRLLAVGTGSRGEEAALVTSLTDAGFALVHDLPCTLATGQGATGQNTMTCTARGLQIWRASQP